MACSLTTGRTVPCKSAFGGIKTVYMANFPVAATINADQTIDAFTGSPVFFPI
jgi:hypothetical protein